MTMCQVLSVARAGFYAWQHNPVPARDKDNQRLLTLIRKRRLSTVWSRIQDPVT